MVIFQCQVKLTLKSKNFGGYFKLSQVFQSGYNSHFILAVSNLFNLLCPLLALWGSLLVRYVNR